MTTYLIITIDDNVLVEGAHYARDDGGDVHVYPSADDGVDPIITVDAEAFVAIASDDDVETDASSPIILE